MTLTIIFFLQHLCFFPTYCDSDKCSLNHDLFHIIIFFLLTYLQQSNCISNQFSDYKSITFPNFCFSLMKNAEKTQYNYSGHNFSKCTLYFKQKYKNKHQVFTILAWQCSLSLVILPIGCFKQGRRHTATWRSEIISC